MPWVTFAAGGTGFLTANLLQFGTLTFDWPMIIGGKPHAPWPSFVPIMFELTILFSGFATLFGLLALMKLPRLNHRGNRQNYKHWQSSGLQGLFQEQATR